MMLPLIIILGAILRLPGLFTDFDLDEVWSFNIVYMMKDPLQIFTNCFADTNHHLNSLFIYMMGRHSPLPLFKYRILSFVLGIGAILLIFLLALKIAKNKKPAIISAAFAAVSFPLVIYSSVARGYSSLIFFSVGAVYLLLEYLEHKERHTLWLFCACYILGFLSHLTFVFVAIGLFVMVSLHSLRRPAPLKGKLSEIFCIFFIPASVVLLLLGRFLFNVTAGGGPQVSLQATFGKIALSLAGLGAAGPAALILVILIFAMLIQGARIVLRENADFGVFILTSLFLAAAVIPVMHIKYKYTCFRHFLWLYPFLIILFSHFLERAISPGRSKKALAAVFALLIIGLNFQQIALFLKGGHRYREAVSYIYSHTGSPEIVVTSDSDFKNFTLLNFYDHFFGRGKLTYISVAALAENKAKPEWVIKYADINEEGEAPPPGILKGKKYNYILEKRFLSYGMFSGIDWILYRRQK
ncbi:MAG: glycosyltransferase family 39 protein [Candidatus Omnitrophota bacterium]